MNDIVFLVAILVSFSPSLGCDRCQLTPMDVRGAARQSAGLQADDLRELRHRYIKAISKARAWLDDLHVDPSDLRVVGIKGKKKLVEQLDAYYRLWKVAPERDRPALLSRIQRVVSVTYDDRYHDMLTISDRWFKQDATSYLRAAVLMERLGLDTTRYRHEIQRAHRRLNRHMSRRGPNQRRIFHWYYRHFGLTEPFDLSKALEEGIIEGRRNPGQMHLFDVYALTHEVFALYEYGDRLEVDPFDVSSKRYLRKTLKILVGKYLKRKDPDIIGELVACLHYLRMRDLPAYRTGLLFLLESQNEDGSWGRYARQRKRLGGYVKQGYLLHTTLVAIGALTAVFDRPMPSVPDEQCSQSVGFP